MEKETIRIQAPILRGGNKSLMGCRDIEVCLDGPAGTGKTLASLYKIHCCMCKYPKAKALISRKTNTALSGSAMATYREAILNCYGHPAQARYFGGNKVKPAAFEYWNGSQIVVNGLDKPHKIKSWEFDIVYINESTECSVEDIEFVRSRLRNGIMPYQQIVMDCNPDAPTHWLNQRMLAGITTRLVSRHEDNPRFFDISTGKWTEDGNFYIEEVLGGLTGVRHARLRYGQWAAAEGTVYEGCWDRSTNVVKNFKIPQDWERYLVVDFGYIHPFVCKWYAVDHDGRIYCYREIYMTKRLVEDHSDQIKKVSFWGAEKGEPYPRAIICDHDAEDRATLERHLGLHTIPAHKSVSDGIQAVASRLRRAGDGRPRLLYLDNCLVEIDPELSANKKPKCSIEEFDSYIWDTRQGARRGDQPVKESDHGMDCDRYMVAYKDIKPSKVTYSNRIF